jgi:hypothetical protein
MKFNNHKSLCYFYCFSFGGDGMKLIRTIDDLNILHQYYNYNCKKRWKKYRIQNFSKLKNSENIDLVTKDKFIDLNFVETFFF